jgi:hypothetical protein
MLQAIVMLAEAAAEMEHEESSKAAFYVTAGLLAGWAVLVSFLGLRTAEFPGNAGGARTVMGITATLVAATMISAILTG